MRFNQNQDAYLSHHHLHYQQPQHHPTLSPPILQRPLSSQAPHLHSQDHHHSSHPNHLHLSPPGTTLAPLPSISAAPILRGLGNSSLVLPPAISQQDSMPHQPTTHLPPRNRAVKWVTGDDSKLLEARAEGKNWQQIQTEHFPFKTPNACRKRHERLIEGRRGEEWAQDDLERAGRAYAESRKPFWCRIASAVGNGMDWKACEKKFCDKGPKQMMALSRQMTRREIEISGSHMPDDMDIEGSSDDDSSISAI